MQEKFRKGKKLTKYTNQLVKLKLQKKKLVVTDFFVLYTDIMKVQILFVK